MGPPRMARPRARLRRRLVRVLAYVHGYLPHLPAGSETMLHELLLALKGAGHDVGVVAIDHVLEVTGADWEVDDVHVHAAAGPAAADEYVLDWQPDVLISHHQYAAAAIELAHGFDIKCAVMFHNDFPQAHQLMRRRPDLAVLNTHWLNRHLAPSVLGIPSVIVHPPVDRERHRTTPGDAITLINLYRMKGPEVLWRLARSCRDLKFLGVKGGYGDQVVQRGYPNVEIIESTQDMPGEVWSRTKLLLVPSRYESFGRVVVEAMASGIPVVASNTAGLVESVGKGGALVPRTNPQAWHRRVRALMDNEDEWQRASAAALARSDELEAQRVTEMATWVDVIERLS
jgi:glycosyltransferase involved in cell wall biosynthesis